MAEKSEKKTPESAPPSPGAELAADLFNLLIILGLVLLFFGDMILRGQVFFAGDIMNVYSPWQMYNHEAFMSGRMPLWTDDFFCGFPLFAESQGALFYPVTRIAYYLSPNIYSSFSYDVLLHFVLAGWFQYFFARSMKLSPIASLMASVAFAFSGMFLSLPINFTIFRSIIWIPLIFTFMNHGAKRQSLLFPLGTAVAMVFQMMGGSLQVTGITVLAMFPYMVFLMVSPGGGKKSSVIPFLQLLMTLVLAVGLYAFQLAPTWELTQNSWRGTVGGYEVASAYSFHPFHFIEALMPAFYGVFADKSLLPILPVTANFFPYIGIVPLFLVFSFALVSRKRGMFIMFILLLLSLALAVGKYGLLYPVVYSVIPFFDRFRAPDRFWIIAIFAATILAGYGIDAIKKWVDSSKHEHSPFASGTFAVIFMLLTLSIAGAMYMPSLQAVWKGIITPLTSAFFNPSNLGFDPEILDRWKIHLVSAFAHFLGVVTLFNYALALFGKKGRGNALAVTLIIISIADLFFLSFAVPSLKTTGRGFFRDMPRSAEVLYRDGADSRFYVYGREFFAQRIFGHGPGIDPSLWYNGGGSNDIQDYYEFREELSPNIHMHWGLSSANGFASLFLTRYQALEIAADAQLLRFIKNVETSLLERDNIPGAGMSADEWADRKLLIDLLGADYLVSAVELDTAGRFRILDDGPMRVYRNRGALPRAWIATPSEILPENDASLQSLYTGNIDPTETLIMDPMPSNQHKFSPDDDATGTASIRLPTGVEGATSARGGAIWDEQVMIEVSSSDPAYLILADTQYPGWKAEIDGQPAGPVYRVFGYFRALEIPAGNHLVRFEYDPQSFKFGAMVSVLTLIAFVLILIFQVAYFRNQKS